MVAIRSCNTLFSCVWIDATCDFISHYHKIVLLRNSSGCSRSVSFFKLSELKLTDPEVCCLIAFRTYKTFKEDRGLSKRSSQRSSGRKPVMSVLLV